MRINMKKCVGTHADGRTSHVMTVHHDMAKLMRAKANNSAFKGGQKKDLSNVKNSKQPGGK